MKAFYRLWVIGLLCLPVLANSQEIKAELWKMIEKPHESVDFMEFTADGKYLITASGGEYLPSANEGKSIKLWDVSTGELIRILAKDNYWRLALDISLDGKYLAYGNWKSEIELISIETGKLVQRFKGHTSDITDIEFTPNGKYVLSGTGHNEKDKNYTGIRVWRVSDGLLLREFEGWLHSFRDAPKDLIKLSPDGKLLAHYEELDHRKKNLVIKDFTSGKVIRNIEVEVKGNSGDLRWISPYILSCYTYWSGSSYRIGNINIRTGQIHHPARSKGYRPDVSLTLVHKALTKDVYDLIFKDIESGEILGQLGGVDVNYSLTPNKSSIFSENGEYLATIGIKKEAFFDENLKPQTRSFQAIAIWKMEGIRPVEPVEIADYTLAPTPQFGLGNFSLGGFTTSSYTFELKQGLNMISPPVKTDTVMTAESLARQLEAIMVVRLDPDTKQFIPYIPGVFEGSNFMVDGAMGVIVNVPQDKSVTFTGTAWSNAPAAPSHSTNPVWAFTVLVEGQSLNQNHFVVQNLSRDVNYSTSLDYSSQMGIASIVDASQQSVINSGDLIQIQLDNQRWRYRVKDQDLANAYVHLELIAALKVPEQTLLLQNYPNPFNPETWLPFELSQDTEVSISIYDTQGQLIRKLELGFILAGKYVGVDRAIHWDGKTKTGETVVSGTYFYQIEAGEYTQTQKMVILK